MSENEHVVLATGGMTHLRDVVRLLEAHRVAAQVIPPPEEEDAPPGQLWLIVPRDEAERALGLIEARWASGQDEEAIRAAAQVVDLDADESTCPACSGAIPGGSSHCPECGLRFG